IDVRSFSLNFEINAILFDEEFAKKCRILFEKDQQNSFEMTSDRYENRDNWTKVREAVSRLISPIL
ncbi:MAG: cardiolipin synthase, partial [Solibacillus sp.]